MENGGRLKCGIVGRLKCALFSGLVQICQPTVPLHTFPPPIPQAIRDIEWEVSEIIRTRTNQEQNITLEMPYYDIVRIKARRGGCC